MSQVYAECSDNKIMGMESLLTVKEVAKLLRLSPQTLYTMLNDGDIPAIRVGNQWRFDNESLKNWIAQQATIQLESSRG